MFRERLLDTEDPLEVPPAAVEPAARRPRGSYVEILLSSMLIGGSSVLALLIGLVRTKALAMLLGPAGFGLFGMFMAVADFARSIAEMGINNSGVRQIAAAAGTDDGARIALTATVLRRTALVLGLIGALLLAAFAAPVSGFTFGTNEQASAIALLGLAVFFRLVADGQGALIQGMRRIGDLAKINVLGLLLGVPASIAIVYALGEDGVALAIVVTAACGLAVSWWYARKVQVAQTTLTRTETAREAGALLKLGFAFMISAMLMMGTAYAVRIIVLRIEGLDAAGLYQAAWALGGLYVSIVLQAMGTDFYPRLVGVIDDHEQSNRLVNEQAQVSLLLAGPGVLATIALAPLALLILYSSTFVAAADVLRWVCVGIALRVVTWPIGYIIVAKNARILFVATEIMWAVLNVCLTLVLVRHMGLEGAGVAFFLSYVVHGIVVYLIVRRLIGFRWAATNLVTGGLYLASIGLAFAAFEVLPFPLATALALLLVLMSAIYAWRALTKLIAVQDLPGPIRRVIERLLASRLAHHWRRGITWFQRHRAAASTRHASGTTPPAVRRESSGTDIKVPDAGSEPNPPAPTSKSDQGS